MRLNVISEAEVVPRPGVELNLIAELVDADLGTLPGLVNLVFCEEDRIQALNRERRNKDQVTDVLTFTYYQGPTKPEELLGEVVICLAQCRRQAEEREVNFEQELYTLIIHGLFHLRGFDHEEDEDYRVMKSHEDRVMKSLLERLKT